MISKQRFSPVNQLLKQRGMLLVGVIVIMGILTVIGLSLYQLTTSQYTISHNKVFSTNAVMVAEAGVEQSLHQLNQDNSFTGYATAQDFFNNAVQGHGTFTTVVADTGTSNTKTITSTGTVSRYNQTGSPVSTKMVRVTVVGTGSQGYSVHTGVGGLILSGSGTITNSDVFVNGTITMSGASKIGTSSQPLHVNVANMACPTGTSPGSTYPQVCTGSSQPISLQYSTYIYGSVCATGQTSTGPNPSGNILPGNGGQGLQTGCVASPAPPPTYDRTAHINSMTTTGAGNSNTYVCNSWPFDRTWPANLKLTGNVTIGGSCNVVIKGNVYITGDLTINGSARVTVDSSVGTTRPVIVADGKITLGGSAQIIANSAGTGIYFISFKSNAACGSTCTSLSGNDLKNAQSYETVNIGGAVNLPGMIFQAYWGKLTLAGSGSIGSAIGQTVDMSGAGTITFGTTLSSGTTTWTVTSYQELTP